MEHTETQREQILRDLLTGARITALEALTRYKCNRLASRIFEIKRDGFNVQSEMITVDSGKKVSQYYIPQEPKPKQGAVNGLTVKKSTNLSLQR